MSGKQIYLERLDEIYQDVLLIGDCAKALHKEQPDSLVLRRFIAGLEKFEELLMIKATLMQMFDTSEEEAGRSVREATKTWARMQSFMSSDRAEESHGW